MTKNGQFAILKIQEGTTDRRLARYAIAMTALVFRTGGGHSFVFLLLSRHPSWYPKLKQVMPKHTTAIKSITVIAKPSSFRFPLPDFYVIGGSQSLRRGLTAYHLGSTHIVILTYCLVYHQTTSVLSEFPNYAPSPTPPLIARQKRIANQVEICVA